MSQMRLGGDSQQTFGHCALCIHPAVEPMATPSGHVYCKECIVEFLLTKTQELKRQREAFEEQERTKGMCEDTQNYYLTLLRTAVSFSGQISQILSSLPSKRDGGPRRVNPPGT